MANILAVQEKPVFSDIFTSWQYHTHTPYASTTLNNNDEIRIPIHSQDNYTLPSWSYLHIEGKLLGKNNAVKATTHKLVSNAVAFLFDEISYEINSVEVDRVKSPGVVSTVKNYLTLDPNDKRLSNAGWDHATNVVEIDKTTGAFVFCYPLKYLLPVFHDYQNIILNVKQELKLLRSSNDKDAVVVDATDPEFSLSLSKVNWRIPYLSVDEVTRLNLLNLLNSDFPIEIPYHRWELHEYPNFPKTTQQVWSVKTSSHMETARYVIVGFQTNRRNVATANCSKFDLCGIRNFRCYLNSLYFPYDYAHGDKSLIYDMYARFKSSYYSDTEASPLMDLTGFLASSPLLVIDTSKQSSLLKAGSVDLRVELEADTAIPDNTTAYCIVVYDVVISYRPLSGTVQKIM